MCASRGFASAVRWAASDGKDTTSTAYILRLTLAALLEQHFIASLCKRNTSRHSRKTISDQHSAHPAGMQVKKRTQKDGEQDAGKKSGPKSFVFCRGKHAVSSAARGMLVHAFTSAIRIKSAADMQALFPLQCCLPSVVAELLPVCLQLILKSLEADLRKLMSPNTATNLSVRTKCAGGNAMRARCQTHWPLPMLLIQRRLNRQCLSLQQLGHICSIFANP